MNHKQKYQEQLERLCRWYKRFELINQGVPHMCSSDYYIDDIYAFFLNCYHLKDWIINDDGIQINKNMVEHFINQNYCMKVCADICNGIKHLKLSRSRSGKQPEFESKHFNLTINGKTFPIIAVKLHVETEKGKIDAFELAKECLEKWKDFIKTYIR
ncbi:MAG: hypothetical protein NDF54_08960 [archaeon GB-1867-035]|nr:hypothetical protein [Candidatus Culexmicrobium profundum]